MVKLALPHAPPCTVLYTPCAHTPTVPCLLALLPSPLQLCTSPEVAAGISAVYQLGELVVAVLLPFAARPPAGKLGC